MTAPIICYNDAGQSCPMGINRAAGGGVVRRTPGTRGDVRRYSAPSVSLRRTSATDWRTAGLLIGDLAHVHDEGEVAQT